MAVTDLSKAQIKAQISLARKLPSVGDAKGLKAAARSIDSLHKALKQIRETIKRDILAVDLATDSLESIIAGGDSDYRAFVDRRRRLQTRMRSTGSALNDNPGSRLAQRKNREAFNAVKQLEKDVKAVYGSGVKPEDLERAAVKRRPLSKPEQAVVKRLDAAGTRLVRSLNDAAGTLLSLRSATRAVSRQIRGYVALRLSDLEVTQSSEALAKLKQAQTDVSQFEKDVNALSNKVASAQAQAFALSRINDASSTREGALSLLEKGQLATGGAAIAAGLILGLGSPVAGIFAAVFIYITLVKVVASFVRTLLGLGRG